MNTDSQVLTSAAELPREPTSPAEFLKKDILEPLGITILTFADALDLSVKEVSDVVYGTQRISVDFALRLSAFTGQSGEFWFNLQEQYERWHLRNAEKPQITSSMSDLLKK